MLDLVHVKRRESRTCLIRNCSNLPLWLLGCMTPGPSRNVACNGALRVPGFGALAKVAECCGTHWKMTATPCDWLTWRASPGAPVKLALFGLAAKCAAAFSRSRLLLMVMALPRYVVPSFVQLRIWSIRPSPQLPQRQHPPALVERCSRVDIHRSDPNLSTRSCCMPRWQNWPRGKFCEHSGARSSPVWKRRRGTRAYQSTSEMAERQ